MNEKDTELKQLEASLDLAPCGIGLFEIDKERPIFLNKAYYNYVGYTPDEYAKAHKGKKVDSGFYSSDAYIKKTSHDEFVKFGKALDYEFRAIRKDGSLIWLKMSASTVVLDGREIALASFTDITREKNLEIQSDKEQSRLQLIADEMNAAVFEWSRKDNKFYHSSSYSKYALSLVDPGDLLMNRGPADLIHPEDLPTLKSFFDKTNMKSDRAEVTLRLKLVGGEYRWCKMIGLFYRDKNGQPERTVGIIIDVNDERERSFMLDSMLNAMPCGVGIFTFAQRLECEYYSDGFTKMAGISREEMDRKIADNTVLTSIIAPADLNKVVPLLLKQTSLGEPLNLTYRYVYGDGSIRWLHLSGTKLRDDKGYPVYYCVFTNPTEETAQYGNVVEDAPTGVYVAEKSTRKSLFANEAATVMFGFEKGHKVGDRSIETALAETGRKPLLTAEQIASLKRDEYSEFSVNQDGKYYSVQGKEVLWNGIVSYILYFSDKTNEQTLLASIPGGVAVYRIKKDGRVATDYVSDGLASMCGYSAEEFLSYLRNDAMVNIVAEDAPALMEKVQSALEHNTGLSVMYRIYTKNRSELLIRLDANRMANPRLEDDDIAVFYAVHTIVSDESKRIIDDQKNLHDLINAVPTGICIYEIVDGEFRQSYMNDAFYSMLGSNREKRMHFTGKNALDAAHPEDVPKIRTAIGKLISGKQLESVTYRLKTDDDGWFWVNLTGSVVERRENYIKIYAACCDYNEVMRAQESARYLRKTMEIALQSAGVLAWRYDYKHKRITDSATLGEAYHLPEVVENGPQTILDMGFIADESKADFLKLFDEIAKEKVASVDTKAVSVAGNNSAWFRQIYTPVFDKNGKYIDAVGIAIDITEQKQMEQHYEEQQRLSKIAAADALSTVSLNLSRNTILSYESSVPEFDINKQFSTADELLSSVHNDNSDPTESYKFDIVSDCGSMLKAFGEGKNHIEIVFHYFHNTRWVKATYDMLKNPYTGEIEAISSLYDVTDSVRAQKVISQLTELDYQSLMLIDVETGKALPYQTGRKDGNMDALISFQTEENDGQKGFSDFMKKYAVKGTAEKVIRENSLEYIKERLEESPSYTCMHTLDVDGKISHCRTLYTYLKGDRSIILSAVQNVTEMYDKEMRQKDELAKALKAAEEANKAKTAFLSRVSHDMRTPLNGILGLTSLMKDISVDPQINHDLGQLEMSGKYLLELINDTLDVSRIESGKLELHPSVCDSRVVFINVQNLVKQGLEQKKISFDLVSDNLPFTYLYVDEGRLQQIAMNILGNAIKFTPEGGNISVLAETLSMKDGIVTDHFVIKDSGCGMSEEFLPHLFEAFSQENGSTTNSKQGTGLGMSITRNIVELLDGEIHVDSEKGKGTTVDLILRLPIATEKQVEEWKSRRESIEGDYDLGGRRVLLCEDHPLNTKIATRLLTKKGITVEHAENGKIGVEMFEKSPKGYYDAILMDIRMPKMDGIDAAKAIRALDRSDAKSIPIIAMTANALADDVKNTREAGMNAHLSKPLDVKNMYRVIAQNIEKNSHWEK